MRIAITGPTGSIGRELIDLHLSEGDKVIAIVNPSSSRKEELFESKDLLIYECDISDYCSLMDEGECDTFYHLAWAGSDPNSRKNIDQQSNNIRYSLDAVILSNNWGAKTFIGSGSQAEYGILNNEINSKTPTNPVTPYGICKYAAGKLCKELCDELDIKFNWARILSVYGRYDRPESLISYLIRSFSTGTRPDLSPCEQIWNLMYAEDCARALMAIAENGINGKTYNVASKDSRPLKEYITELRGMIAPSAEIGFGARPYYDGQTMYLSADISELIAETGFEPQFSFKDGIGRILSHF